MSDRRGEDTTVADSGGLVGVLLHIFQPLFVALAAALENTTSVMPLETVRDSPLADGAPHRSILLAPALDTTCKTADTSPAVSGGDICASFPAALSIARGSVPLQCGEAASHDRAGVGCETEAQRRYAAARMKKKFVTPQGESHVQRVDTQGNVRTNVALAAVDPQGAFVPPEAAEDMLLPPSGLAVLDFTPLPPAIVPVSCDKVSTKNSGKRGRPPLTRTVAAQSKKENLPHTRGPAVGPAATPALGATTCPALPFCFTISNAILWEAVAALAEAVLVDGACFSWLRDEVQRRTGDEQERRNGRQSPGATPRLPSPARMLADALLHFNLVLRDCTHWRELTGFDRNDRFRSGNSADEFNGSGIREIGAFVALPPETQDAMFKVISAALVRAISVYTAHLLSPLCMAALYDGKSPRVGGDVRGQGEDAPHPTHGKDSSQPFVVPSRGAEHDATVGSSSAVGWQAHVNGAWGAACDLFPSSIEYPQPGLASEAMGECVIACRSPPTFKMVEETLKKRHRRTLEAQQLQQVHGTPMPVTECCPPTPVFSPTAPSLAHRASSLQKKSLETSEGLDDLPLATAAGLSPSLISNLQLELVVQRAGAQDNSCFYVQMSSIGCEDTAIHTEATGTSTVNAAACATEFTVHVLCSALSSAMAEEATAVMTSQASEQAGVVPSEDVAAETTGGGALGVGASRSRNASVDERSEPIWLSRDAPGSLVRRWCAGLEQLACTTFIMSACSDMPGCPEQDTLQSTFTVAAASLFVYLRDSTVNPQSGLLADYAVETGRTTPGSRAPPSATGDICGGEATVADSAAVAADTAISQSPWATAQWSIRPVVGVRELDCPVSLLERAREPNRGNSQHPSALPPIQTDSAADAYPLTGTKPPTTRDTGLPREAPSKRHKVDTTPVASSSPGSLTSVEWLRLSDPYVHPTASGQLAVQQDQALPLSTAQAVETSTAALFKRFLGQTMSVDEGDARAAADILSPLEEVGTVLATLDAVCAGRTLVDGSAWRYGRNRMNVAAVSIIGLSASDKGDDGFLARGGNITSKKEGCVDSLRSGSQGVSGEEKGLPPAAKRYRPEPMATSGAELPLGLYQHESGVLHIADGSTYALEVD